MTTVRALIDRHFMHFNAREVRDAARAWQAHVGAGGRMMVSLAGAMSTAGIGGLLAPAIRAGLVHAISCTGANLEEDAYALVGRSRYRPLPDWRTLSPEDERDLCAQGMNRVTDTAIPDDIMLSIEALLYDRWRAACESERSDTPAAFLLDVLREPDLRRSFEDPDASWLLAADACGIPIWTPGWEDSTTGNAFTAAVMTGVVPHHGCVVAGTEQMAQLIRWYMAHCEPAPGIGLFQIGGGIAGDFPVCAVPLIAKDLRLPEVPLWGYFAQVTDAVSSYGGYSGAPPNEKISWHKLGVDTPRFNIQSDASIVMPLVLAYLLGDGA